MCQYELLVQIYRHKYLTVQRPDDPDFFLNPAGCARRFTVAKDEEISRLDFLMKKIRKDRVVLRQALKIEQQGIVPALLEHIPDLADRLDVHVRVRHENPSAFRWLAVCQGDPTCNENGTLPKLTSYLYPISPPCPLWVISGHLQCKMACPLYPESGQVQCN